MKDIINKKPGRMLTENYSASIGTKRNAISCGKTSFELFHRKNIFRDPVNGTRNYILRTGSSCYKRRLKTSRNNAVGKQKRILCNTQLQVVKQNKKRLLGKSDQLVRQKKVLRKFAKKLNVLKLTLSIKFTTDRINVTAIEKSDFSSTSARLSRSFQVASVKCQVPRRKKDIDFKKYFFEKQFFLLL